jgi:hypothetical protein
MQGKKPVAARALAQRHRPCYAHIMDSLTLSLLPGILAVCRLERDAPIPAWALQAGPHQSLVSVTRTSEELSIVCAQDLLPPGARAERGFRAFKVAGPLDFSLTGVLASLTTPLAEAGVSVFAVSTFDTDYLLVREVQLAAARKTLSTVCRLKAV